MTFSSLHHYLIVATLVLSSTYFGNKLSKNKVDNSSEQNSTEEFCASHHLLEADLKKDTSLQKELDRLEENWVAFYQQRNSNSDRNSLMVTLPVVFHVIHNNGPENISDAEVLESFDYLNNAFANENPYDPGTGVNTAIQFCLAQEDPFGNPTTGINHVVSTLTDVTIETEDVLMKDVSRWDPTKYINIWVVKEICSTAAGCGVAGYAYFPTSHGNPEDGLVVEAQWLGGTPGDAAVLAHEMGHYLGLYHTFQGGCGNSDCLANGDRVCDTPPDQSTVGPPCDIDINSCTTDVNLSDPNNPFTTDQNDMFWNYMDYGEWDCYSAFTQGQADRMDFFINNVRFSLTGQSLCDNPCVNPMTLLVGQGDTIVNAGTTLTFPNNTIGATSFEWEVNETPVSTNTNLTYTFSPEGTYTVTLNAFNGDTLCDASLDITVIAFDCIGNAHVSDSNGADVADCGEPGNPCKTIQYALDNIICSGDTVFIHSDTYQLPAGTNSLTPIALIPENYAVTFMGVEDNGPVIIDGNNERRGFNYSYYSGSCPDDFPNDGIHVNNYFNFYNLTIQNTYNAGVLCGGTFQARAAGIYILNNIGSNLTIDLQNCIFNNNTSEDLSTTNNAGRSSYGGAIYLNGRVNDPGAATSSATVQIRDSEFTSNQARQMDNGGFGGAVILINFDTATISNSYFCNNSTYSENSDDGDLDFDRNGGGALVIFDSHTQFPGNQYFVDGCTFVGNSATTANGATFPEQSEGGAIFMTSGDAQVNNTSATLTIGNSHFYDNTIETGIEHIDNNSGTLDLTSLGNNVFSDSLDFSLGNDTTLCLGTPLFATYLPGATYEWSTGETTSSVIVNAAGIYAVTVSLGQCSTMDEVFISVENCAGTEICDNGIDDDGDGLIDCFDPDCCSDETCLTYYYNECDLDCFFSVSATTDIELEIEWESSDLNAQEWCSYNTPITGDIDGDGIPEVIGKPCPSIDVPASVPYPNLLIVDGATGLIENFITTPAFYYVMDAPAIADVDGDGYAEIFVHASDDSSNNNYTGGGPIINGDVQRRVLCYEYDGSNYVERWMSDEQIGYNDDQQSIAVSVADFNGDGIPELHCGNQILNSLTGELIVEGGASNHNGSKNQGDDPSLSQAYAVAVDALPDDFCANCSGLELVAGGMVFSVNIDPANPANNTMTVEVSLAGAADGWTSIADLDRDGDIDAVVSTFNDTTGLLYAWDIQTATPLYDQYQTPPSQFGYISQANIADFDGDGFVEIGICSQFNYQVLKPNASTFDLLWSIDTDDSSGSTGASVFDFNNDGSDEVIYRTETELLVLEGATGMVASTLPCESGTRMEYPVVVDVDADGETELLCSCDGKLVAYGSASTPWIDTRSVWNQRNYFNVNIEDDLSVPTNPQQQHIVGDSVVMNNFLTMYGSLQSAVPDATAKIDTVICMGEEFELSLTICNTGDNTLTGETPITFYNSDPTNETADTLLTLTLEDNLLIDSCKNFVINITPLFETPIYVVVNDDFSLLGPYDLAMDFPVTAIAECDYTNNIDSFLIADPEPPILDLGMDTLICHNGVLDLNAGSGFETYEWFDGSTDSTFTVFGPGEYWVEVTSICGVQRDTIEVEIQMVTDIMLPPSFVLCDEDCATLEITDWFDSYQWIPSDYLDCDTCSTVVACPPVTTTYIVIGSSDIGCFSIDTVTIIPIDPTYTVLDTAVCLGEVVEFNGVEIPIGGSEVFELPGQEGCVDTLEINVSWNGGDDAPTQTINAFACDNDVFIFDGVEIPPNTQETFNYQTYLGCDSVIIVNVAPLPTYQIFFTETICSGDSILIFGNYESNPGVYNMTFTSAEDCDSSVTAILSLHPSLNIDFDNPPICSNASNGIITATPSGSLTDVYSYLWSTGATTSSISNLSIGDYGLTVTDGLGCTIAGVASIFSLDVELDLSDEDAACFNENTGSIAVTNAEPGWMFSLDNGPFQSDSVFNGLAAGDYTITVIDGNGCEVTETFTINSPSEFTVEFPADSIEIFINEQGVLEPIIEPSGLNNLTYTWTPSEGLTCNLPDCSSVTVSGITEPTTYVLEVALNPDCAQTASITVIPKVQCDGTYALPNAFTPDGDGVNDVFALLHMDNGLTISSFDIYNRWGNKVFESEGVNTGWNGTYKNKPAPMDVYIYVIEILCPDGEEERVLRGDVTLIR